MWFLLFLAASISGLFALVPLASLLGALAARVCCDRQVFAAYGFLRKWLDIAALTPVVLATLLEGYVVISYRMDDLWKCIALGIAVLVRAATDHDTQQQSYLYLVFSEAPAGQERPDPKRSEDMLPLVSGSLDTIFEARAIPLLLFRTCEVLSCCGCLLWFHMGSEDLLLGGGGVILGSVLLISHGVIMRLSTPWMCGGLRRTIACCAFVGKPILDEEVSIVWHYVVIALMQLLVFGVDYLFGLPVDVPAWCIQALLGVSVSMWPLLLLIRNFMAAPGPVTPSVFDLATKVAEGRAHLDDLPVGSSDLPQLLKFCQVFCDDFFGDSFSLENDGALVKLDLARSSREQVRRCLGAMVVAAPLFEAASKVEIDLDGSGLLDPELNGLLAHLPIGTKSFDINISHTEVGDVGVVSLAQMVPRTLGALEVGLNATNVTDKGLTVLAQHLPPALMSLGIVAYETKVTDRGLTALAHSLPDHLASLRIGLYKTKVGDEGITSLAQGFPASLQILRLELSRTQVTDVGASAVLEHLPETIVKVEANTVETQVSRQLQDALAAVTSIPTFQPRSAYTVTQATRAEILIVATSWSTSSECLEILHQNTTFGQDEEILRNCESFC
eukprot:CAMPEP_0206529044 /NCGR_PEP_ID=MMETSP0325_2-20121206/2360_1 /ASSEMBLY_ACC=CAM_ASM_000347 /TAXON_ID=2866 /ORGANISM="Crypthecodinium cohnii, Strain Seligo" /LENGTH=614 /DNA_ID=CAMNT_0054024871 /DNA_START=143 /DNA_END=1985 /DNA_ORIENTATION=-